MGFLDTVLKSFLGDKNAKDLKEIKKVVDKVKKAEPAIEQLSDDELKIPVYNPETMETNVEGLFLAGVVCGGMQTHKWFIENSRIHANMIVAYISSK